MSSTYYTKLDQIQKYFEGQMDTIRTISDLELSQADYISLRESIKSLYYFSGPEDQIQEYMLSVVVFCTYTLIYGECNDFETILWKTLNKSQYMERTYLQNYLEVFANFDINTYDMKASHLSQRCEMVTARHAGIPNSEKNEVYNILLDYIDRNDYTNVFSEAYARLPQRTRYIVDMFSDEAKQIVTRDLINVVNDVMDGQLNHRELLGKYKDISISFIDHCILWNEGNRHQIRFGIK